MEENGRGRESARGGAAAGSGIKKGGETVGTVELFKILHFSSPLPRSNLLVNVRARVWHDLERVHAAVFVPIDGNVTLNR